MHSIADNVHETPGAIHIDPLGSSKPDLGAISGYLQ
jgi:hypothetical protein